MVICLLGDCDKRPILYALMKMTQAMGDVFVISNDSRLLRLSDTHENYGHYQNTMIATTWNGIDDFLDECPYDYTDFAYTIVDGMLVPDADVHIYVQGLIPNEFEEADLEYLENYEVFDLYSSKGISGAFLACEKFESYRNMPPINSYIADALAGIMAKHLKTSQVNLSKMAMAAPAGSNPGKVKRRASTIKKKGKLPKFGKK